MAADVIGISNVAIGEMMIEPGTEEVDCGFLRANWTGNFGLTMGSDSNIMVNDGIGTFTARCLDDTSNFTESWRL